MIRRIPLISLCILVTIVACENDPIPAGMVLVQGGTYQMGSDDGQDMEKPVHEVKLNSFYMDIYEVTIADFKKFVEATNYVTDAEKNGGSIIFNGEDFVKQEGINWRFDALGIEHTDGEYKEPVTHLSWNDANAYAEWVGKRLPTEAEWEYAARGGEKGYKYAWGNDSIDTNLVANVSDENYVTVVDWPYFKGYDDGYVLAAPVGSFEPNSLGLYDMAGNAWEWCQDYFDEDYYKKSPTDNPVNNEPGDSRVMRGNSWDGRPGMMRCSRRTSDLQSNSYADTGFRCVKDVN